MPPVAGILSASSEDAQSKPLGKPVLGFCGLVGLIWYPPMPAQNVTPFVC